MVLKLMVITISSKAFFLVFNAFFLRPSAPIVAQAASRGVSALTSASVFAISSPSRITGSERGSKKKPTTHVHSPLIAHFVFIGTDS
jgi:hypothetical protein